MLMNRTGWGFLVCLILLAGACSDDTPVTEPESKEKTAPGKESLPVREWYPTPKHARPRITIPPSQPAIRTPMPRQPSSTAAPPVQQQWNTLDQPYAPVQPQMQWYGGAQQWQPQVQQQVMPQQYPYGYPYQYEQRPWGSVPDTQVRKQPGDTRNGQSQGAATDYWGVPVYPGGQYYGYPAPGMPGYVW